MSNFENTLIDFIPQRYKKSQRVLDLLKGIGYIDDRLVENIDNLRQLVDVETIPQEFLSYLLENEGVKPGTLEFDTLTNRELLRNLFQWYALKGTDKSFEILFYSKGFKVEVLTLWTEDYSTFLNPLYDTIPSTAYPTSHFVLKVQFNTVYDGVLLPELGYQSIQAILPSIIPINNVLDRVYFSGIININSTLHPGSTIPEVYAIKTDLYFGNIYIPQTDTNLYTDDGVYTDEDVILQNVFSTFQYGSGHKTSYPEPSDIALETYEGTGVIDSIQSYPDYFEIVCIIPSSVVVENGVSEFAIFDTFDDMMVIGSFPDIAKEEGYEVELIVRVFKTNIVLPL